MASVNHWISTIQFDNEIQMGNKHSCHSSHVCRMLGSVLAATMCLHIQGSEQPCEVGAFIQGTERSSNLIEVTQLRSGQMWFQMQVAPQCMGTAIKPHCFWRDDTRISKAAAASAMVTLGISPRLLEDLSPSHAIDISGHSSIPCYNPLCSVSPLTQS